jgi:hypothetical protein
VPERIECVDNRSLLVANHPHFFEIDAPRRQIFGDIANVLILGAARQDHQERGRDSPFGSGRAAVGMITYEYSRRIHSWSSAA